MVVEYMDDNDTFASNDISGLIQSSETIRRKDGVPITWAKKLSKTYGDTGIDIIPELILIDTKRSKTNQHQLGSKERNCRTPASPTER